MANLIKNKTGIIIGFALGMVGFLLLFKIFVLSRIPPQDEIAPGMVVIASILCGVCFAFAGRLTQHYLVKKKKLGADNRN